MAFYMNIVCDGDGCKTIQPFEFEQAHETFQDVLDTARNAGWSVVGDMPSNGLTCLCPNHEETAGGRSE